MNRTYHKKYEIIANGCPLDKTVQFHQGESQVHRFSMNAFRYIGESTTTVYIHCKLFLCHKSSTVGKCSSGCSGNNFNRVKRDINENSASAKSRNSKSYLLEVGPIVKDDANEYSSQNGGNSVLDVKFIVMGIGMVALVVAVVALLIKRRKSSKKPDVKVEEIGIDNVASGNAFVVGREDNGKA